VLPIASPTHVALGYDAPAECPDAAAFVRRVKAREPRFEPVPESSRGWEVLLIATDSGVVGKLTTTDASGARATRSVEGATCEEVVGALVLVAALALDAGPPAASSPSAAEPAELPPALPPNEAPVSAPRSRPLPFRLASDLGGLVTSAVAPNPLFGFAARLDGEWGSGWLSPAVRLGVAWAASTTADVTGGSARFTWTAATIDACPVRWNAGAFHAAPCVRLDAGALRGMGYIAHPSSATTAWVDLGLVAEAQWVFARPVYATLDAGLLTPLTRVRYHFDNPDSTVHTATAVEGTAGLGLGMYFW
jgi:hypothetical protein